MAKKKTPEQIMCLSVFHWKITSYLEPPLWLWLLLLLLHHRTSLLPLGGECYTLECCTLEWGVGGGHGQIPGKIGQPFPPPLVRDGVFPRRKISQTDKERPFWSLILPPQIGNKNFRRRKHRTYRRRLSRYLSLYLIFRQPSLEQRRHTKK